MKAKRVAILVGVLLFCSAASGNSLVGVSAPTINVRQWITPNPPDIKNLKNTVYLLEFWATWCKPCVRNIPHLMDIQNKYGRLGLEIVALSQDKSADLVKQFVRDKGMNYNVAIDNGTADFYGIRGYPTIVIINHRGKVAWVGYPWDIDFDKQIKKAVTAGPPPHLAGVELGPFKNLRKSLWPGRKFPAAYKKLRRVADESRDTRKVAAAVAILRAIDKGITEKIALADKVRRVKPHIARGLYATILEDYGRVDVTAPAEAAYLELKDYNEQPARARLLGNRLSR